MNLIKFTPAEEEKARKLHQEYEDETGIGWMFGNNSDYNKWLEKKFFTLNKPIELPVGVISENFSKVKAYCNHFNCVIHKEKDGYNIVETEDPINLFWLGANLHLKSTSSLTITPAEKYL